MQQSDQEIEAQFSERVVNPNVKVDQELVDWIFNHYKTEVNKVLEVGKNTYLTAYYQALSKIKKYELRTLHNVDLVED